MMALYHKYRPKTWNEIIGNRDLVDTLKRSVKKGQDHVYLISGQVGCGKTTIARIIANELGAKWIDTHERNTADYRGIDEVREIMYQSRHLPIDSDVKVYLLDECHKMTEPAQHAFLKELEDTPKHVYFILITTDPLRLIKTVRSRCAQYQVSPLTENRMAILLKRILKAEKEKLSKSVLNKIIEEGAGLPRNTIQILEKVLNVDPERRLHIIKELEDTQREVIELCRALMKRKRWYQVRTILNGLQSEDPETIRRVILGYCSKVLLNGDNLIAGLIMEDMRDPFYDSGFPGLVSCCYSICHSFK